MDGNVEVGALVGPGTPVVRLVAGPRTVTLKLPPDELARLEREGLALIFLGRRYPLSILRTAPVPDPDGLTPVELRLTQPDDALPFGGSALVRYRLELARGPIVPIGALSTREGRTFVYGIEAGKARAYPVVVVAESEGRAVVRGDVLPQTVVYPLPQDLVEGARVEVLE